MNILRDIKFYKNKIVSKENKKNLETFQVKAGQNTLKMQRKELLYQEHRLDFSKRSFVTFQQDFYENKIVVLRITDISLKILNS